MCMCVWVCTQSWVCVHVSVNLYGCECEFVLIWVWVCAHLAVLSGPVLHVSSCVVLLSSKCWNGSSVHDRDKNQNRYFGGDSACACLGRQSFSKGMGSLKRWEKKTGGFSLLCWSVFKGWQAISDIWMLKCLKNERMADWFTCRRTEPALVSWGKWKMPQKVPSQTCLILSYYRREDEICWVLWLSMARADTDEDQTSINWSVLACLFTSSLWIQVSAARAFMQSRLKCR